MYDKCYFCLDQLPKLKKESTASFFVNFGRSRGTKEPTYITVPHKRNPKSSQDMFLTSFHFRENLKTVTSNSIFTKNLNIFLKVQA